MKRLSLLIPPKIFALLQQPLDCLSQIIFPVEETVTNAPILPKYVLVKCLKDGKIIRAECECLQSSGYIKSALSAFQTLSDLDGNFFFS